MSVPLPAGSDVLLTPPDAAEARWSASGIVAAARCANGLTELQRLLLAAMFRALTGFEFDIAAIEAEVTAHPLDAHTFAEGLARRDLQYRGRIVQVMVLTQLVVDPPDPVAAHRVAEFAAELLVHDDLERLIGEYATGGRQLAGIDFDRNGYLRDFDGGDAAHLHVSGALTEAWQPVTDDAALAARWAALADLPAGTLGHGVHEFYQARGFVAPGNPGSAPPLLAQHDWVHVLADYGTKVESEIEVFALIARANDDLRAFSLLAMVVSLFETGSVATGAGLFEADRGHLSQPGMTIRLADAMRRGALCQGSTDFLGLDWFSLADRPVEVVRAEFGMPPKQADAIRAGSVGPWEAGGISPYQIAAGRQLAAAQGREYRAPGQVLDQPYPHSRDDAPSSPL